ncbi:MAG: hypothetical protein ABIH65_01425 [Nanoarchaeota archaeon]
MEKTRLPAFKGKPLIAIPENTPQAGFLEGDFGKAFLAEYQGKVKIDYKNANALNVLSYTDGIVKESNPFVVVLANQILKQEGLRTANQADLERVLKTNAFNLRGTYEDTGLVLRTEGNPNEYLAKNLAEQVKARGKKAGETPILISLNELEIVNDSNSPKGLVFKLTDEAELIYAPILNGKNNQKSFSETGKYGLPEKLGDGNRTLYTRDSGLSRLYLGRGLSLISNDGGLADSGDGGRVVVVSGEATSQKILDDYLKNLQEIRDKQISEVDRRYKKAEKVLSGK